MTCDQHLRPKTIAANAYLIAAAPTMFMVLRKIQMIAYRATEPSRAIEAMIDVTEEIDAVIDLATGKSVVDGKGVADGRVG